MRFFTTALIFCGAVAAQAQSPAVPHKMHFAGMTLTIRDDARREIQKDVDALTQSPKYFGIKVERARTYFPIIEKIFAEERVPDDFKFLCLQESALIADAVSVSDAVGFWQFKDFTAQEVGLRVDKEVDERMNIVSSTRGAARYIKQNNFMFNNWLYALQAYQMGAGGVKRLVGDDHDGARHMEITAETYWYVKKFLAHKVAFEGAVDGLPQLKVTALEVSNVSLAQVAERAAVDVARLREYNKWIKNEAVPADKNYTVILPHGDAAVDFNTLLVASAPKPREAEVTVSDKKVNLEPQRQINNVPVIEARPGETFAALARRAGVDVTDLMKFNEVEIDHEVVPGVFYFLDRKRTKTDQEFHTVKKGEDLWKISQQYGVLVKRLKKYNRMDDANSKVAEGTVLWLSAGKPREEVVFDSTEPAVEVEENATFDWVESLGNDSEATPVAVSPNQHRVAQGETMYSIARATGLTMGELLALNGLEPGSGLKVGQVLKIADDEVLTPTEPGDNAGKPKEVIHEVQPKETLYSVARQYGVTIKELMEWNEKTELSVAQGERLRILARQVE